MRNNSYNINLPISWQKVKDIGIVTIISIEKMTKMEILQESQRIKEILQDEKNSFSMFSQLLFMLIAQGKRFFIHGGLICS